VEICRSRRFSKGGGSLWVQILYGRGHCHITTVGVRKLEWLPFCVVSKYPQCVVWFCHKARMWQTDGRRDRQNYDSQDRASIAAHEVKTAKCQINKAYKMKLVSRVFTHQYWGSSLKQNPCCRPNKLQSVITNSSSGSSSYTQSNADQQLN